jgi:hypothetical protein
MAWIAKQLLFQPVTLISQKLSMKSVSLEFQQAVLNESLSVANSKGNKSAPKGKGKKK